MTVCQNWFHNGVVLSINLNNPLSEPVLTKIYTTMRYHKAMMNWYTVLESWLNSLWPSDVIWRHRSGSTLAQVMACCLTAPSYYLNQCWLITSKVHWHSLRAILQHQSLKSAWKSLFSNFFQISLGPMSKFKKSLLIRWMPVVHDFAAILFLWEMGQIDIAIWPYDIWKLKKKKKKAHFILFLLIKSASGIIWLDLWGKYSELFIALTGKNNQGLQVKF